MSQRTPNLRIYAFSLTPEDAAIRRRLLTTRQDQQMYDDDGCDAAVMNDAQCNPTHGIVVAGHKNDPSNRTIDVRGFADDWDGTRTMRGKAFREGAAAFTAGAHRDTNPYVKGDFLNWEEGWLSAHAAADFGIGAHGVGAPSVATTILINLDRAGDGRMLEPEEADRIYDSIVGPLPATCPAITYGVEDQCGCAQCRARTGFKS